MVARPLAIAGFGDSFDLISSFQFFWHGSLPSSDRPGSAIRALGGGARPVKSNQMNGRRPASPAEKSDATTLGRTAAVMQDRRDVADGVTAKPTACRARSADSRGPNRGPHLDLERAHAVLHGLAAGILGRHLRGDTASTCASP